MRKGQQRGGSGHCCLRRCRRQQGSPCGSGWAMQDSRRQKLISSCPVDTGLRHLPASGFGGNLVSPLSSLRPPSQEIPWGSHNRRLAGYKAETSHQRAVHKGPPGAPASPSCQPPTTPFAVGYPWLTVGWPRGPELVFPKAWPYQPPPLPGGGFCPAGCLPALGSLAQAAGSNSCLG